MADRGIIFAGPMVLALLDRRKRNTRRLIKPIPIRELRPGDHLVSWPADQAARSGEGFRPPWAAGDRLYVRERFRFWAAGAGDDCEITFHADGRAFQSGPCTGRIPDASLARYFKMVDRSKKARAGVNYPSIHLPRWASRLWLAVESVRIERLQDISREDCAAEGHPRSDMPGISEEAHLDAARDWFIDLWDGLHRKPGERWADNPWVARTAFTVHSGNIDALSQS